jgi:hypothetical protein
MGVVQVELYWIPLGAGAGGALVRWSGRFYELISSRMAGRPRLDLFHSALAVSIDVATTTVEMAPVWVTRSEPGVVAEGAVGCPLLGHSRLFPVRDSALARWNDPGRRICEGRSCFDRGRRHDRTPDPRPRPAVPDAGVGSR